MKNKKGFTLIELLAVIVVLAIIALIATPIVMNTIKKSKKGAAERSADSYVKQVEVAVATKRLEGDILEGTYTINDKGNLEGNGLTKPLVIEMNGNKPTGGTIKISNGQVTTDSKMTIGSYEVAYNPTTKKYEATEKGNIAPDTPTLVCDLQEGTSQTVGAKYTCHLDFDRTFYVLETSGDTVNLIMDRNFTDDTVPKTLAWCVDFGSKNTCKNITSKEEETPLRNIQDVFGTNVEVSLPSYDQIYKVAGNKTSKFPTWLFDYLNSTQNSVSDVYGYWTSTPHNSVLTAAWDVSSEGALTTYLVDNDRNNGVRPVITILKSKLN